MANNMRDHPGAVLFLRNLAGRDAHGKERKVIKMKRDEWERNVKAVRQKMLDRTVDPRQRQFVAAVIDAFADKLYNKIEGNELDGKAL